MRPLVRDASPGGREAPLRYVLRPKVAQERLEPRPEGLVRIIDERYGAFERLMRFESLQA